MQQFMPMTKDEFYKEYWFSPYQMVTLVNPKAYDYKFMVEMRHFMIAAGATETLPGPVANVYLSEMTGIMAQDDDKMALLSDYALKKIYYDKLIVDVKSTIKEVDTIPSYLKNVPAHVQTEAPEETPPWQQPPSAFPETNSQMSNTHDTPDKLPKPEPAHSDSPKETTKEFELEGMKYRMVIDKNDKETFFRDGRRIDAATYSKAASMI